MRELTTGFQPIDRIIYHSSKDIERLGLNKEYSEKDSEALTDSIHVYRSLQRSCRENAVPNKARKFLIRERHCRRKRALSDRKRIKWLRAAFMRRFANYAEGYTSILLWSGVIIIGSAILYPSVGGVGLTANEGQIYAFNSKLDSSIFNGLPNNIKIFLVSLYFSLVTFTTLGYGDIQPIGAASKAIAGIESLFGVILMAVLVFVLGRRATW